MLLVAEAWLRCYVPRSGRTFGLIVAELSFQLEFFVTPLIRQTPQLAPRSPPFFIDIIPRLNFTPAME